MPNCSVADPEICCAGESGTLLSPFVGYDDSPPVLMSFVYLLLLFWLFMGVALAADVFMGAIEQITSTLRYVKQQTKDGSIKRFRVRTWNPTVANLTLMALGSSAPEILLSTLELISEDPANGLYNGKLGPSTIVGSAAFNLFVIIAVCVVSIPSDQVRVIAQPRVYGITAFFSVFAYVWMAIVLLLWTPNLVTVTEGIITLLLFPLVVWLAFVADKSTDPKFSNKWSRRLGMSNSGAVDALLPSELLLDVKKPDGTPLEAEELHLMIKRLRRTTTGLADDEQKQVTAIYQQMAAQQPKSRAYYRVNATRMITAGKEVDAKPPSEPQAPAKMSRAKVAAEDPQIELQPDLKPGYSLLEFASESYAIIEAAGTVTVQVMRGGDTTKEVQVEYETVDGTAKGGGEHPDFEEMKGVLTFAPGETTCAVTIKIFDDDEIEPDEVFSVQLTKVVSGDAQIGAVGTTTVTIINDDFPGTFILPNEDLVVKENDGVAKIQVNRVQGCSGEVSLDFKTLDGTALAGRNYTKTEGTLKWTHQEVDPKVIEVPLVDDDVMSGKLYFELEISNATGGALFDEKTDGSKEKSLARVSIQDDDAVRSIAERAIGMLGSQQGVQLGLSSWGDQFRAALSAGGADDDDGEGPPEPPSLAAKIIHVFALPWKLICAFVPPPGMAGGYPCFAVAIVVIGAMTAVIGDLANLLGCSMGLKAEIVAFTFVALGTSLPDTFASRSAAMGDPTADAAVGNVTGSNAVNVFLGCGVSWMLGSVYWATQGVDAYWIRKYPDIAKDYGHSVDKQTGKVTQGPTVGLAVPAGSLGISVIVFCLCAIICIFTLLARRMAFGGELGSKLRVPTAVFFVGLWLTYVTISWIIVETSSPQ